MPYFAWRKHGPLQKDSRQTTNGIPPREVIDLDLLSEPQTGEAIWPISDGGEYL